MHINGDGQRWYAERQTVTERWFAIGAAGHRPKSGCSTVQRSREGFPAEPEWDQWGGGVHSMNWTRLRIIRWSGLRGTGASAGIGPDRKRSTSPVRAASGWQRHVGFHELEADRLSEHGNLIEGFSTSAAFTDDPSALLYRLREMRRPLPASRLLAG